MKDCLMRSGYEVVVVGGGVIGCATAYALARAGRRVALVEQFAIGHELGSSHGPTRIIRLAYDGDDYVALAGASYEAWRRLASESGQELLVPTGGLDIGVPDAFALDGIRATFERTGVPFELLDRDEIQRRFPQFTIPEGTIGIYQADYGLLAADRCVATLAAEARRHGAEFHEGERVLTVRPEGEGVTVATESGTIRADRVVLSAGSWSRPLLAALGLDLPLRVLKEQLAFFAAGNPGDYVPGRLPLVIHRFPGTTSLGSVFPIYGHAGVKVMIDRIGTEVAPDDPDRSIDAASLDRLRDYAMAMMPGLTGKVIDAVSCRYTMTPDEDFVLDRHPAHPNIVVAASCSGHGFKFAPVIGEILADLALDGATPHDISRFRLERFSGTASER
ncbi:MAG: N-methyl-L-tryptophan oxidase [Thermomicrobiales bacterium]|nr:N-methyl-L-tryptophan oxidase [Thermomicrobiales bacterium]